MVECQARDLEVRGSNPGPGLNFSLEFNKAPTVPDSCHRSVDFQEKG